MTNSTGAEWYHRPQILQSSLGTSFRMTSFKGRALALDVGQRRIGLAISDSGGLLATPYTTITVKTPEEDIAAILTIAKQEQIALIVVGLPLSLDGTVGPQARFTLDFCDALRVASHVPVETWDERYSTVEAEVRLREAGVAPSRHRARLDAAAATVLLQSYLDARREPDRGPGVDATPS
jgi:putative holliday junction resolvase